MKVLIVEDDTNIQKLITLCIVEIDPTIQIFVSESSIEALQIAKENTIDVFILDIQLTDYKGTELARELREIEKYLYTPMIFATALATEELNTYRQIKCYSYLIKPFTKEEVKEVIIGAIDYRHNLGERKKTIRIEQKSYIFEYDLKDIVYIESFGKKMILHLATGENRLIMESISGYTLKGIFTLLNSNEFIQCHKSYIINKKYITRIAKAEGTITLERAKQDIPIGQTFREKVLGIL